MPLLFSLGVHNALRAGNNSMTSGEHLLAFLDDTCILSLPQRARPLYNVMGTTLETGAGIHLHAGKTRIWKRAGIRPPDIDDLGEEVWSPDGVKVLGSPIGTEAFIQSFTDRRLEEERRLWNEIPSVPDLQCAWQLLVQCAGMSPRVDDCAPFPISQVRSRTRRRDEEVLRGLGVLVFRCSGV